MKKIRQIGHLAYSYRNARNVFDVNGITVCLCSAMGMGGGFVPYILIYEEDSEVRELEREQEGQGNGEGV